MKYRFINHAPGTGVRRFVKSPEFKIVVYDFFLENLFKYSNSLFIILFLILLKINFFEMELAGLTENVCSDSVDHRPIPSSRLNVNK